MDAPLNLSDALARRSRLGMPAGYSARKPMPTLSDAEHDAADALALTRYAIGTASASATNATFEGAMRYERRRGIRSRSRADT